MVSEMQCQATKIGLDKKEWTNHEECLSRGLHIIHRRKQELYQHNGISTLGLGLVIGPYIRQAPAHVHWQQAEDRERAQPSYVI